LIATKMRARLSRADEVGAIESLFVLIEKYWDEIHHIESQRSTLTNILLAIESAALGVIVSANYSRQTFPLSLLLVVLGLFGVLATRKYHERFAYAQRRLDQWYRRLDQLTPEAEILARLRDANERHAKDGTVRIFRRYHLQRLPLNRLWLWLHGTFAVTGLALSFRTVVG